MKGKGQSACVEKSLDSLSRFSAKDFVARRIDFRESSKQHHFTKKHSLSNGSEGGNLQDQLATAATVSLCPENRVEQELLRWKEILPIGCGLQNLGNTCFLNSVLQCLLYTAPFGNFLLQKEHSRVCRIEGSFCVLCELERLINACFLVQKKHSVAYPQTIAFNIKAIGKQFRPGRQEDAHEFLRFLLESVQKSLLNGRKMDNKVKETSVLYRIFGGSYESSVTCLSCRHVSRIFEPWLDISLEIKNCDSLQKALKHFTTAEKLHSSNKYKCDSCKSYVEAYKQMLFERLAPILTVHLKRFTATHKIGSFIAFPEQLDMTPFCTDTLKRQSQDSILYDLYAVLVHQGSSCVSGHYYAFVKGTNGFWYSMNDSCVSQVSLKTVLNQNAYILFYSKHQKSSVEIIREPVEASDDSNSSKRCKQTENTPQPSFTGTCFWRVESI